jgi:hypothetical protein
MRERIVSMLRHGLAVLSAELDGGTVRDEDWLDAGLDPLDAYSYKGDKQVFYIDAPDGKTYRIRVSEVRKP